jgi:hypothetical protein
MPVPPHVTALQPWCDLQRSALARHILSEDLYPEVEHSPGFLYPPQCQLNPALDVLAVFTPERKRAAAGTHFCKICAKHFQSAWHLDRHFLRAHAALVPTTARVCLADYCDVLDCAGFALAYPERALALTTEPTTAQTRTRRSAPVPTPQQTMTAVGTRKGTGVGSRARAVAVVSGTGTVANANAGAGEGEGADADAEMGLAAETRAATAGDFTLVSGLTSGSDCGRFDAMYCSRVFEQCFPPSASAEAARLNVIFTQHFCEQHRCAAAATARAGAGAQAGAGTAAGSGSSAGTASVTAVGPGASAGAGAGSVSTAHLSFRAAADATDLASGLYSDPLGQAPPARRAARGSAAAAANTLVQRLWYGVVFAAVLAVAGAYGVMAFVYCDALRLNLEDGNRRRQRGAGTVVRQVTTPPLMTDCSQRLGTSDDWYFAPN